MKKNYILIIVLLLLCLLLTSYTGTQNDEFNNKTSELESQELEKIKTLYEKFKLENEGLRLDYSKIKEELLDADIKIRRMEEIITNRDKRDIRIVGCSDKVLKYVYEEDEFEASLIKTIIGYNPDKLLEKEEVDVIDYRDDSGLVVKLKIFGSLYDFEIVKRGWDEKTQATYDAEIICKLEEVRNKDILFNSILPCGFSTHEIRWIDKNGNQHSYYVIFEGYGFSGTIIWDNNY
ncbi:UNVERIFIED_CONTAM: hypothetical protein Cloal_0580 [Acetivibrio alkalicellulosi]